MQNVLFHSDGHNNYHDDSDFFSVYLDIENKEVVKHITHSTRGAGYNSIPVPHVWVGGLDAKQLALVDNVMVEIAKDHIRQSEVFYKGDVVKVIKGRKLPIGTEFVVTGRSEFKDRYGRVCTQYLHGEFGKVSISNCEIVERAFVPEHIKEVVDGLKFDPYKKMNLSFHCRF